MDKLHHFGVKIGYPDHWRDYSALVIKRDDLLGDIQRAAAFEWNRQLKRIDQPVDKTEWGMSPPTVNAYNNPQGNEIVFPAAIMQPPFFDPNAPATLPALAAAANNPTSGIRVNAITAMQAIGSMQAVPLLIPLVKHKNDAVEQAAITALQALTKQNFHDEINQWKAWWTTYKGASHPG